MKKSRNKQNKHNKQKKEKNAVKERLEWVHNDVAYGTQRKDIIENSFMRRAKDKLELLNVWASVGTIFILALFMGLIYILAYRFFDIRLSDGRFRYAAIGMDIAILLLCRLVFTHLWDEIIGKYWTCPHCGKELPVRRTRVFLQKGVGRVHLLADENKAQCPYCQTALPDVDKTYIDKSNKSSRFCFAIILICLLVIIFSFVCGGFKALYNYMLLCIMTLISLGVCIYRIVWIIRH